MAGAARIIGDTYFGGVVAPTSYGTQDLGTSDNPWGTVYADTLQGNINASQITSGTLSVSRGGTGKSSFTANSVIMSGTSTTSALTTRAVADSSSASAISTNNYIVTERDIYYGLPTINNSHTYTSSTTIYAPTAGGTSNYVLMGNGTTAAPIWKTPKDALNIMINALDTGSSNLTSNDYVITQYVGGGTTTTTYHRRPASALRVGGLLTARKLKVALDSTTDVTFDGTADQTSIPVNGTLPIAQGGTGATTAAGIRENLGLSNAMHFIGKATVAITNGSTTNPTISGYDFTNKKATGDVIIDKDTAYEYVWTTEGKWERLGGNSSYKVTQTAVAKPDAVTNKWVSAIGQNANGVIDVSYTTLDTSGTWSGLAAKATGVVDAGNSSRVLTIRWGGDGAAATDWIPMYDNSGNLVPVSSTNLANKVRDKASGSWNINATSTTYIKCTDTRDTALNPTDLTAAQGVRFDFKAKGTINLTATDPYAGVMSFRPYGSNSDWSGGNAHQIAFNSEGLHWRNGGTSWGDWYQILDSNNYTDYTVTKTGTGASGTWGISISGLAAKATADGSGNNIVNTYLTKTTYNTGAKGDIIYWSAANTPAHLTNTSSTTKNFLSITSQVPAWTTLSKSDVGLGNVTNDAQVKASLGTAKGDLLYWSASATPARLGIGTNGYFLTVSSGAPAWSALPTASTSAAGIVQLSSATNSTSTTLAATASAVKAAYDLANGKTSNTGTVTSITISATSPVAVSASGAITTSGTRTISLADAYGDTKNPYGTKTANYVLAGPSSGNAAAPSFRALVAADIPNLAAGKITSGTFDAARIPSLSTDKLTSGTLPVGRGGTGQTSIANIQAGKDGDGNTISSTYLKLSGGTLTGRLTTDKAINAAITGTYTAAVTSSPYKPVKWTFNTGSAPSDGDIFTIKTPGAGHDYGVFISVDNGATYQPVVRFNKSRLTTHYDAGTYLTVIYSSSAVTNSVFPADGATSRSNITGSWQILNEYDSGNDVYQLYSASGNGRPVETSANGGLGLHGYTLQMMTANQAWSSIACTSGSTAANSGTTTTKVAATCNFLLGSPILYMSNNSYVAPGGTGNVNGYTATSMNLKYSTSGSYSLTVQKPVYLVGTINSDKATFKLVSSNWWTQTLPTSKDGKIYIMLGLAYDANSIYLATDHPIFYHNGKCVTLYGGGAGGGGILAFQATIAANQWGSANSSGYSTCRLSHSDITAGDVVLSIESTDNSFVGNFMWTTANGYLDLKTTNPVATTLNIVIGHTDQDAYLSFSSIAAV